MSSGEYLAVKRRQILTNPSRPVTQYPANISSAEHTANKQYLLLQTTYTINEDLEPVQIPDRFGIPLPEPDLAWINIRARSGAESSPSPRLWSLPKPPFRKHVGPPIVPNRYPPPPPCK
jgi:hypothetical protein